MIDNYMNTWNYIAEANKSLFNEVSVKENVWNLACNINMNCGNLGITYGIFVNKLVDVFPWILCRI